MDQVFKVSLAAARVNAKLTQKEAAVLLGLNVATLKNYENGKTSPTWETIQKMENVYQIPLEHLNIQRS